MFAAEKDPGAIEQASLALRVLDVRAAVPYIRIKIPQALVTAAGDEARASTDWKESHPLPRVLLYETNLRSVATLIVPVYERRGLRRFAFLLGIASIK
jgi:hypothetical protein